MSEGTNMRSARADAERAGRIAGLFERGVQAAMQAYDPSRHLVGMPSAKDPGVRTYRQASSLPLAHALLLRGEPGAVREAAAIVEAVLESQELSPCHPHRGNWLWLADDPEIADINAVQFVLRGLLPLLCSYGHLLPDGLQSLCRERVRLALDEQERMDVAPTYTNIHIQALFALVVGGEWLDDAHYVGLGRERWDRWVRFTTNSGAPHEFNSPNYGGVDLSALGAMVQHVKDPAMRLQARLMYERLWLHFALHIHRATRQVAGPHCRCYWGPMMSGQGPLKELVWRETGWTWPLEPGPYGGRAAVQLPAQLEMALTEHEISEAALVWLGSQSKALPCEVRECADIDEGFDLTTYLSPSYALGTASRTYGIGTGCFYIEHQANYLHLYYTRPDKPGGWAQMYSRFVVNDRHWGVLGAAPDRSKTANFYDQGHFCGVQLHNKAIGLYALMPQQEEVHSIKTVVAFQSGSDLERVWVNDTAVTVGDEPCPLSLGDWLIVEDGGVYVGVYPLEPSCLGREAPIRLERGPLGELWLAIYNYRGSPKRFWDYASLGGAFWQGNLRAGYIVEVAERDEFSSAREFLAHLAAARIDDRLDDNLLRTVTNCRHGMAKSGIP